jgi:hypothetical protein
VDWLEKAKNYLWQNGNIKNSPLYQPTNYDSFIDICFIAMILGLLFKMIGLENLSKKLTGIGFLVAILLKVLSLYV